MAVGRFRSPKTAKEIMEPRREIVVSGEAFAAGTTLRQAIRYTVPTGRFTIPRRSLRGLRQLPRKERAVIRKGLRARLRERFGLPGATP